MILHLYRLDCDRCGKHDGRVATGGSGFARLARNAGTVRRVKVATFARPMPPGLYGRHHDSLILDLCATCRAADLTPDVDAKLGSLVKSYGPDAGWTIASRRGA